VAAWHLRKSPGRKFAAKGGEFHRRKESQGGGGVSEGCLWRRAVWGDGRQERGQLDLTTSFRRNYDPVLKAGLAVDWRDIRGSRCGVGAMSGSRWCGSPGSRRYADSRSLPLRFLKGCDVRSLCFEGPRAVGLIFHPE